MDLNALGRQNPVGTPAPAALRGVERQDERFFGGRRVRVDPDRGVVKAQRLRKVVVFGHSLIGRDMDAEGSLAKALLQFFGSFEAPPEVVVRGVTSSRVDQWLGHANNWPGWAYDARYWYPMDAGPPVGQLLQDHPDADLFVVSLGANDVYGGIDPWELERRMLELERYFSQRKLPLVWIGHAWSRRANTRDRDVERSYSDVCLEAHRRTETRLKEHDTTLFVYPRNPTLEFIYDSPRGGSLHPSPSIHRRFLRATSGELLAFLGADLVD